MSVGSRMIISWYEESISQESGTYFDFSESHSCLIVRRADARPVTKTNRQVFRAWPGVDLSWRGRVWVPGFGAEGYIPDNRRFGSRIYDIRNRGSLDPHREPIALQKSKEGAGKSRHKSSFEAFVGTQVLFR